MKNPIIFILLILFTLVNLGDAITSYFILDGESNPIYLLIGSIYIVYIIKLLFVIGMWLIWWKNIHASHFLYFIFIMILLMVIFTVSIGMYSNIKGILNPQIVEAAKNIPVGEKIQYYKTLMLWIYIIPMSFSLIGFKIYEWTLHKTTITPIARTFRGWWNWKNE